MKKVLSVVLVCCLLLAAMPMMLVQPASAKPALDTTHPSYRPDDGWRMHPQDYKLLVITFDGPPDSASTTTNTAAMRMINAVYNCGGGTALINTRASYLETHGAAQLKYAMERGFEIGVYPSAETDEDVRDQYKDHTPQLSYYPLEEQREFVTRAYKLIVKETGYTPNSLRPPFLHSNADTQTVCRELGLYMTGGNASSLAPGVYYKPETAGISVENYVNCAYDGAFWISHPASGGAAALEQALPIMYDMGFRFCSVEEIFKYRNQTPQIGTSYREVLRDKNPLIDVNANANITGGTLTFGEYAVDGKTSLVNTVANQVIRVKATPDEGKILVPGSLTYTTASGKTVPIVNKNMQLDKFGEGDGYSFEFVAPIEDVTVNAQFVDVADNSFAFDTIAASVHKNANGVYDGIRFLTRFNLGTFDTSKDTITVLYNGEECTVTQIGMLLKRATNTAELTLDNFKDKETNKGVNSIWNAPAYDLASGTLAVVDYTASYLDVQVRMMKGDTTDISTFRNRKFTARGYMIVRNAAGVETVLYSASTITKCVNDIVPPVHLRPEFGEIELQ